MIVGNIWQTTVIFLYVLHAEPLRMKQTSTGLCWAIENNELKLTSKCRDLFIVNERRDLVHYQTGINIYSTPGPNFEILATKTKFGVKFIVWNNSLLFAGPTGSCITMKDDRKVYFTGQWKDYDNSLTCNEKVSRISFLPGRMIFYFVL